MAWICDKNGNHRCEIKQLSYNGTFMEVSSITVTVESPAPVSFAIGDYIDWDYDGLRYTLDIAAGVEKQARRNSVGNAFVYENLVFLSPLKAADNADFLDVILGNTNDFLTNTEFSFYGTAWDYAKRLEANLCRLYGSGTWKVRIWTGGICYDDSPATGIDTGAWENKLVDVSGIKCLGGFQQIYDLWGCAYVFSVVNGVNYVDFYDDFEQYAKAWQVGGVDKIFAYGKGNGLYKIRHTPDADHVLVTRLRPYGSGENIPANYYFNSEDYHVDGNESSELAISHLMLPASQWTKNNVKHPSNAYLEQNTDLYGVREGVVLWDGSDEELGEIKPSIYGLTIQDLLSLMSAGDSYRPVEAKWPDTSQRIDKIITGASPTDNGAVAEAGYDFTEVEASGSLEDHSFGTGGSYSRADIVFDDLVMGTTPSVSHPAEYRIVPTSQDKIAVSFEVQESIASTIKDVTAYLTPYVGDVKVEDATFPCFVSEDTISHTVDGITYKKRYNISLLDSTGNPIVFSTMRTGAVTFHFRAHIDFSVENSGFPFVRNEYAVNFDLIRGSKAIDGFFAVTIPQIGFDLSAAVSSGAKLCMRSGANQPREFAIVPSSVRYLADSDTWYIRCKRSVDQSIKTYFPNSDAVIAPGDEYYLSGIVMPSLYVEIAANKLLAAATAWLNRHSKPRMLSSVDVDNKIMVEESIVLKEGMALPISDTDLGITTENQEGRVIDNIRIEEGTDSIRTFSITLRDKKEKSSLDAAIRGATSNFATNSSVSEALNAAANTGHGTLTGRDMPNQHPISAITGLEDALLSSGFFELGEQEALVKLKQAYDYLGPRKGLIFEGVSESDADLYVKEITVGNSTQRVLYSPLPLITEGDQIVGSGTPCGGGGGGAGYLHELQDVNISNPTNGQMLAYNATTQKWVNADPPAGRVQTVATVAPDANGDVPVADLKTALSLGSAAYQDTSYFAAASHTHSIGDVSGLNDNLSAISGALQSLQAQIDSVATRDCYDELLATALVADIASVSDLRAGRAHAERVYLADDVYFEAETVDGVVCVKLNSPLITTGDQILGSGTPGGGGSTGATYLWQLDDVDVPNTAAQISNGQALVWDAASSKWKNRNITQGTVTRVDVGSTQYGPENGIVSLPAYPTTLPASDVYAWAKAATKPSYALSELTGADDVQAIEALSGTSGLLRKTGANTWELDTNQYVTSSGVTSITAGTGLSGGTITTSGTISISSTYQTYISHGESAYNALDVIGPALQSLQAQIDSIAARDCFDEILATDVVSDLVSTSELYADNAHANRLYLTDEVYLYAETVNGVPTVRLNAAFVTAGDQVLGDGDPGGGGGGSVTYLYELMDVDDDLNAPSAGTLLQWYSNKWIGTAFTNVANGDLLTYASGRWTNVARTSVGIVTDATQSAHGLMSAIDKTKLDGINTTYIANGETAYEALTTIGSSLQSLQAQIDSVASRDMFDELKASSVFADVIAASDVYAALHGSLEGNADTATDADKLDGQHGSYYATASAVSTLQGYFTNGVANNADKLDGQHGSYYATAAAVTTLQGYFTNGVANDADKLDGVHASGLFTAMSSGAAKNLSVTIGGTNKTATLYATYDSASENISDKFTIVGSSLQSLQGQIDAVASRVDISDFEATTEAKMDYICDLMRSLQAQIDSVASRTEDMQSSNAYFDIISVGKAIYGDVLITTGDQTLSDERRKKITREIVLTAEQIASCRAVAFDWTDQPGSSFGSIAQDWQKILPESVSDRDDTLYLYYGQSAEVAVINLAREVVELKKIIKRLTS